jgi:4-deoxy-L-threo-5-hexosulose-uronate ketol-isomerase
MNTAFHIVKRPWLPSSREASTMDTSALREHFLISGLFAAGEIRATETGLERMIVAGAMPRAPMRLPDCIGESREWAVINLGGAGALRLDGQPWGLDYLDCLYIGAGCREIELTPCGSAQPRFYLVSSPAHREFPTTKVAKEQSERQTLGEFHHASRRVIHKCIHPGTVETCQLTMGFTKLEPGCVWNTMPPHTHAKRSEIYLYLGLENGVAVHLMGEPDRTRSLIVRDMEAVLSPPWSVHTAAGTTSYLFVWCMAGENRTFEDMNAVDLNGLY